MCACVYGRKIERIMERRWRDREKGRENGGGEREGGGGREENLSCSASNEGRLCT